MNASNNDYITLLYTGDIQQSRLCNQISGNRFFWPQTLQTFHRPLQTFTHMAPEAKLEPVRPHASVTALFASIKTSEAQARQSPCVSAPKRPMLPRGRRRFGFAHSQSLSQIFALACGHHIPSPFVPLPVPFAPWEPGGALSGGAGIRTGAAWNRMIVLRTLIVLTLGSSPSGHQSSSSA